PATFRRFLRARGRSARRPAGIPIGARGVPAGGIPVSSGRFVGTHGHFYQPPRANPWLPSVQSPDAPPRTSAWSDPTRAALCAPDTAARCVDDANRILDVVNNFEKISFNVGPTLFAWLARAAPEIYRKIIAADRASAAARGGHGNAIAQVYNHMIL